MADWDNWENKEPASSWFIYSTEPVSNVPLALPRLPRGHCKLPWQIGTTGKTRGPHRPGLSILRSQLAMSPCALQHLITAHNRSDPCTCYCGVLARGGSRTPYSPKETRTKRLIATRTVRTGPTDRLPRPWHPAGPRRLGCATRTGARSNTSSAEGSGDTICNSIQRHRNGQCHPNATPGVLPNASSEYRSNIRRKSNTGGGIQTHTVVPQERILSPQRLPWRGVGLTLGWHLSCDSVSQLRRSFSWK